MFDGIDWQSGKDPPTFSRKLEKFESKLMSNLQTAAKALVEAGVQLAKRKAPVDTGRLRDSISGHIEQMMEVVVLYIQTDVDYAIHQEFGTVYQNAQPFLRPALKELESSIVKRTARAYNDALRSVF